MWSEDCQDFVPAGSLAIGEQLLARDGRRVAITDITPRAGPEPVYNLQVHGEHVYQVGSDGLLVHNAKTKAPRKVYRGLRAGEDPAKGLSARAPGVYTPIVSHVAGKRTSQWISTTKSKQIAMKKYGRHGIVEIDLRRVPSEIVDISRGIPGRKGQRMSNWAAKDKEVLIKDFVPPEAIIRIFN